MSKSIWKKVERNPVYESPFDIFPVATWVLVVGVLFTIAALIYLQYLYV
jgi:hypothetical protein